MYVAKGDSLIRASAANCQQLPTPVALVNNSMTPYRLNFHRRLVEELPTVRFMSVFTHEISNSPWRIPAPPEINPFFFGVGQDSLSADALSRQVPEWRKAAEIIQLLERERVQAVIIGGYSDAGRLRLLAWCRRSGIPCFLFADSNLRDDPQGGLKRHIKRLALPGLLRQYTGILCCGTLGEEYFKKYGVPPERLFRCPYEPDYALLQNVGLDAIDRIYRKFDLSPQRRYLLYSGRLITLKRVDLLLKAFHRISERRPEWDLIVAGGGEQAVFLHKLVPQETAHRVIWTGFIADYAVLAGIYAGSHVLVLPSDFEPWGVVVTEAAQRMPVVASSAVGAAEDLIKDGVNGRVFPKGDLSSLEEALLEVTDAETLRKMTIAAPQLFAAWHRNADPVKGMISALVSTADSRISKTNG